MRAVYKGKHDTLLNGLKELEPVFDIQENTRDPCASNPQKGNAGKKCWWKQLQRRGYGYME